MLWRGGRHSQNGTGAETQWQSNTNSRPAWRQSIAARLPRKKDEDGALLCAYGCIACGLCVKNCSADAIHIEQFHAVIDAARCLSCGACAVVCPRHVIKDRFGVLTPVH